MTNNPTQAGRHGRGDGADDDRPELLAARAPSHAERCRTLVEGARSATLCTIAREPAGYPYGSLVTVAWDRRGRPLMLLSRLAEHTQNLDDHAEASMLVTEAPGRHEEVLALGRVTLLGPCAKVPASEAAEVRATFLAAQPRAAYYVDFDDFAFYRLEVTALRYVGGFGRMSWVGAEDYASAEPDPLAGAAAGILAHMNDDHGAALLDYAKGLLQVTEASAATMTAVDRYGFDLAVTTPKGPRAARLAFDGPVATSDEVRGAMVALVKRARAALG
jgi:putative heme iron utilization protein